MEIVRRKSLGPDGNQLIARANQKSIPLLWDRYESQLPLDARSIFPARHQSHGAEAPRVKMESAPSLCVFPPGLLLAKPMS